MLIYDICHNNIILHNMYIVWYSCFGGDDCYIIIESYFIWGACDSPIVFLNFEFPAIFAVPLQLSLCIGLRFARRQTIRRCRYIYVPIYIINVYIIKFVETNKDS